MSLIDFIVIIACLLLYGNCHMVKVVNLPEPTRKPLSIICRSTHCPSTSHCHSLVFPPGACCPRCSCKDRFGYSGNSFSLHNHSSCMMCECRGLFGFKYAFCRKPTCPRLFCQKTFKPAGRCCPICKKEGGDNRKPFPTIPPWMIRKG